MRWVALLLAPALCWAQAQKCDTGASHKRYAFLVANATYAHLPFALSAVDDLQAMRQALRAIGFDVTAVANGEMPALVEKDQTDFLKLVQPGDLVFFYYSGHIVQGADGDDYVLASNFDSAKRVTSPSSEALSVGAFLDELSKRKPGKTIVMIEGPRPIGAEGVEILGSRTPGLSVPKPPDEGEILFAMSAEERQMASLATSPGTSPFTKAVAQLLHNEGMSPGAIFEQAREDVINQFGISQAPLVKNYLKSGFCFLESISKVEPPPPPVIVEKVIQVDTAPKINRVDREEYVKIAHGIFKMGCVPTDPKCKPEEKPRHDVTLTKDFWLGRNEVQVDSFNRFWTETKRNKKDFPPEPPQDYRRWTIGNLPMANVTWQQASDYCTWAGGRLPTEAEWEYAARAGASDEVYPLNSENSRDKANFDGKQGNDTYLGVAPVRKFDPNGFKLYDMSGNVWEWVADWFGDYTDDAAVDPQGPASPNKKKEHIVRGGSYESDWKDHLRLSLRFPQAGTNFKVGFRCVLDDTPETRKYLDLP